MCISLTLYYMAHRADIERFIILNTDGKHPNVISKHDLLPLVEQYIYIHSHGVDEDKKVKYVEYICKQMVPSYGIK